MGIVSRWVFSLLVTSACLLPHAGCCFDSSGLSAKPKDFFECSVNVYRCGTVNEKTELQFKPPLPPPPQSDPNCLATFYQFQLPTLPDDPGTPVNEEAGGLRPGTQPYWCKPHAISYPQLIGAGYIQSPLHANQVPGVEMTSLEFDVLKNAQAVYVAYDNQATVKPLWLTDPDKYEPVRDPKNSQQQARIVLGDASSASSAIIELGIWRSKQDPQKDKHFVIPGNATGNPAWPVGHNPALYLVIIEPVHRFDCSPSKREPLSGYVAPKCEPAWTQTDAQDQAQKAALDYYRHEELKNGRDPNAIQADTAVCKGAYKTCTEGSKQQPLFQGFVPSSIIRFDPKQFPSFATIEAGGKTFNSNVAGTIHFEYVLDSFGRMPLMNLNSVVLQIDPLSTPAGNFTDLTITSLAPTPAICQDKSLPFGRPGDHYQIPTQAWNTGAGGYLDGQPQALATYNTGAVDIFIDHKTRSFRIAGGPLAGALPVNGKTIEGKIAIDLTGYFENFAPQARGTESQKYAECEFAKTVVPLPPDTPGATPTPGKTNHVGNRDPIRLDASASFDIYFDPLPTNPAAYRWYEDYGLATQRLLAVGRKTKLQPHGFSYGVHTVTLLITDTYGAVASDTFNITVGDSVPPQLVAPPNILRLVRSGTSGPVHINLGQAIASDTACPDVDITNDAPAGNLFPIGKMTKVTWTADDGHGNMTTAVQEVTVHGLGENLRDMSPAIGHLKALIGKANASNSAQEENAREAEFTALIQASKTLTEHISALRVPANEEETRAAIERRLTEVTAALTKAQRDLASARQVERQSRGITKAVACDLMAAIEYLNALGEGSSRPSLDHQQQPSIVRQHERGAGGHRQPR